MRQTCLFEPRYSAFSRSKIHCQTTLLNWLSGTPTAGGFRCLHLLDEKERGTYHVYAITAAETQRASQEVAASSFQLCAVSQQPN